MTLRAVLLTAALAAGVAAPAADAAPWKRVTVPDGTSIDQVGLARSADGVLHLAWHHRTGPNTEDLLHTPISASGKIGAATPIQSGWTGFSNPAVVNDPAGGIRVFWGGYRTTESTDPQKEINTALSVDGGTSWALQPGQVNPDGAQAYASPISATVSGDHDLPGLVRDARHVGARRPVARRRPTTTTRRRSAATATTRTSPPTPTGGR